MNGLFNVQQALLPGLPGQVGRIAMAMASDVHLPVTATSIIYDAASFPL